MIYIVPSRGRPHKVIELVAAWEETRTFANLLVAVDFDDPNVNDYRNALYDTPPWVRWMRVPTTGMNAALNYCVWTPVVRGHTIIGFMGDDHRPRTAGWDTKISASVDEGALIVYANDLLQGANLPTQVALDARVIKTLGHMAPPALRHLYLDNYWKTLGERTQRMSYLHDVVIEHVHPIAGKTNWDEGYERVNAGGMYAHDKAVFDAYVADGRMLLDIEKVRAI